MGISFLQISLVLKMRVTCLFLVVALAVLCLSLVEAVPVKRGGWCKGGVSNCMRCRNDNPRICDQCKRGAEPIDGGAKCKYVKPKLRKKDRSAVVINMVTVLRMEMKSPAE